ncbi:MAG TPA: hypothetical protein P5262_03025 [Candidatus Moranbacteria bacterium]|nr:hypothetical protein [Candidatus Moranbacteria bacterium]
MGIFKKVELNLNIKQQEISPNDIFFVIDKNKKITTFSINNISLKLPELPLERPSIIKSGVGFITLEDLEIHPMNLANRWDILKDFPNYKTSDHQKRFIITIEESGMLESYVIPKFFEESEPIAKIVLNKNQLPIQFTIEISEIKNGKIQSVKPQKPKESAKILMGTQILGHVQDAAKIIRWAEKNGTLQSKWKFALPATKRTEVTKSSLKKEGIDTKKIISDWSYAGGKNFRTNQEYIGDFSKKESFSTVVAFIAANARLCIDVAKGKYAVVSTNFRSEARIMKIINPNIITMGVSHTFLSGKLEKRIGLHDDLPRFAAMLREVQQSLDLVPNRITSLGGNVNYIDYYWKVCEEKIQVLDILLYRTLDFDTTIPPVFNGITQVIQIPLAIRDTKISKNKARENIASIIGKKLKSSDKIIILSGESDDGSFKKRIEKVICFAKSNPNVHVVMPLDPNDERISDIDMPSNAYTIGFRRDWREIIPGGDITFIRGSWGELIDLIFSETVPIITSPGTVPTNADLSTTQFLTEVSEERACNVSLFVKILQSYGIKTEMINRLLVDLNNPSNKYTLQNAIEYALQSDVANKIKEALSAIPKDNIAGCIGKLHEQLLDLKKPFSTENLKNLHQNIWHRK